MTKWKLKHTCKLPSLKNPLLIEGLPGVGNVGKFVVDFLIDELNAKKVLEFQSYYYPNTVFVNEDNLVELPTITLHLIKQKNRDILLLAGDVQPVSEEACFEFSDAVLDLLQNVKGKELITLGGIALRQIPKQPKVYCTGTDSASIKAYKKGTKLQSDLYGVVGPIIGVSGVLLGLAGQRKLKALSLLAETHGHPMYLGIQGAREIIKVLNQKLNLKIDMKKLDKDIKDIEAEIDDQSNDAILHKYSKLRRTEDTTYIG